MIAFYLQSQSKGKQTPSPEIISFQYQPETRKHQRHIGHGPGLGDMARLQNNYTVRRKRKSNRPQDCHRNLCPHEKQKQITAKHRHEHHTYILTAQSLKRPFNHIQQIHCSTPHTDSISRHTGKHRTGPGRGFPLLLIIFPQLLRHAHKLLHISLMNLLPV